MAQKIVDLELEILNLSGSYSAGIRVDRGMDSVSRYGPFPMEIDQATLLSLALNFDQYGLALTEMLFASPGTRDAFATARGIAQAQNTSLRVRLFLGQGAEALHALRWELLYIPGTSERLSTREDILFSRYLPAQVTAPAPGPKDALRALVAIASPANLDRYALAQIDVPREARRAETGLAGIGIDYLPSSPSTVQGERCTLNRLAEQVPGHQVLYLVCHGKIARGDGMLLLEEEDGSATRVPSAEFTRRLAGSMALPRLAVLVICESAGSIGSGLFGALGPRLVKIGIPAVLAMQGALSLSSADAFLPRVFRELQKDGLIDRAVSVARRSILGQADETAPVLLMSLESGLLWAPPASGKAPSPAPQPAAPSGISPAPAERIDTVRLYHILNSDAFALEDLEELCFLLEVDWEQIPGRNKSAKARELVLYFNRHARLGDLVAAVRDARPNLEW